MMMMHTNKSTTTTTTTTTTNTTTNTNISTRVARSGKDYAKLFYEALTAAGVPKGSVLKIIQDAEKNSGIRPTKTMRSELSELTLPNIMILLPDELFITVLTNCTLEELLYFSLTSKEIKRKLLTLVKNPTFPCFEINFHLIDRKQYIPFTKSLVWLSPKIRSFKFNIIDSLN